MLLVYRWLLRLYPTEYRSEYGDEILAVLSEVQTGIQKKRLLERIVSNGCEVTGLLYGALCEHVCSFTSATRGEIFFRRRLTMRSEFRFPKATVTLMTIILLAIFLAIDKARAIQASIPYANPQVGPIHPTTQFALLPSLLIVLAGACLTGAVGWAILFAFGRSGVHRLSDAEASGRARPSGTLSI